MVGLPPLRPLCLSSGQTAKIELPVCSVATSTPEDQFERALLPVDLRSLTVLAVLGQDLEQVHELPREPEPSSLRPWFDVRRWIMATASLIVTLLVLVGTGAAVAAL
jgi:hypothetical protein